MTQPNSGDVTSPHSPANVTTTDAVHEVPGNVQRVDSANVIVTDAVHVVPVNVQHVDAVAPTQPAGAVEEAVKVATVPAPETVPEVVASASVPSVLPVLEGHPIAVDPVAIAPGGIEQLIQESLAGATLKGLVLAKGLEVVTILIGKMRFPGPDGPTWDACYGVVVPPGAFVIILAKNVTDETVIGRATWFALIPGRAPVAGDPARALAAATQHTPPAVAGAVGPYAQAAPPGYAQATFAQAPPPPPGPQAVKPGTNEVVVLLQRSECERLLRSFTGGEPVPHHDHPGIIRQLTAALSR